MPRITGTSVTSVRVHALVRKKKGKGDGFIFDLAFISPQSTLLRSSWYTRRSLSMVVDKTNNPVHPTTFKRKQMGKADGNYRMGLMERTDRSATETRGPGKIPSKTTPATAQARTTETCGERTSRVCCSCSGDGSRMYMTMTIRK